MATETPPESSSTTGRPPVHLPTYLLGDEGKPNHFTAATSRESAATEAESLSVGDAAFIKRSDLKWTYAIVTEKVEEAALGSAPTILRFEVDKDGNRKSFPEAQWGKYIRVIKVEEGELANLEVAAANAAVGKAEEEVSKAQEEVAQAEEAAKPEEAPKDDASKAASIESDKKEDDTKSVKSSAETAIETEVVLSSAGSTGGESTKSTKSKGSKSQGGSSWFSGLPTMFGGASSKKLEDASSKKTEGSSRAPPVVSEEGEEMTASAAATSFVATETPDAAEFPIQDNVAAEPMKEDPAAAALAATSFPTFAEHAASVDEASVAPAAAPTPEAAPVPAPQAAAKEEHNNTKENSDPILLTVNSDTTSKPVHHPVVLPFAKAASAALESTASAASATSATASSVSSVASKEKDTDSSKLRIPLNLKKTLSLKKKSSIVNRMFNKNKDKDKSIMPKVEEKKTVTMQASPMSPNSTTGADPKSPRMAGDKKEWFDPEACEVDYDKNPTDLFQALEARQFSYAEEMFVQVDKQFTKECKTWVVARGQKKKDSQLRFRALPLHAALVFGAPDAMITKILNAYPKATRGRDVKGRLPIHLAMEHNASEEIVASILEAFPKGFFAKDKKDMTPLDYVNGNMDRAHMKKYMPLLTAAKVEDERTKWEIEKEESLEEQRARLKNDPVYMEDVIEKVTEKVETTYSNKMELLDSNYQKEIELLKKKHDSETQALLEGFEVKLNFERKLLKLKTKV